MGALPLPVAAGVDLLQPVHQSEDALEVFLVLLAGFGGGLYLVYDGFETWQLARLLADTPTSTVRSMAAGRVELEGTVREHETTIDPPFRSDPCVYVRWEVERRERRTDDDGDTYYVWETKADGWDAVPFGLDDDTGSVLVRADVDDPEFDIRDDALRRRRTYGVGETPEREVTSYIARARARADRRERRQAEAGGDGLLGAVVETADSLSEVDHPLTATTNRRRYTQTVLPVGTSVTVFGAAESRRGAAMDTGQADLLQVRRDEGADEYLISDLTERKLKRAYSESAPVKTVGGLALSAVCLYLLLSWYLLPLGVV
jgi:hypothetical protein